MISASDAFHAAVYENSPEERILLRFSDNTFLSNEDIQVGSGVSVSEAINFEEELTIGTCLSSVLEASIINDHRLLSGYEFGDCAVSLGVRTGTSGVSGTAGNCLIILGYGEADGVLVEGYTQTPYLRMDGEAAPGGQPPFPVYGLIVDGRKLYCISAEGEVWAADWRDMHAWSEYETETWDDLAETTWSEMLGGYLENSTSLNPSPFMKRKLRKYANAGRGVVIESNIAYEFFPDGFVKHFEYVPLGVFRMDIPTKRKTDIISVQSYDRMISFDVDAGAFLTSLTYPITVKQMLRRLCDYVNVALATTGDFINSEISFQRNPVDRSDVTCRDILGWIAQLACAMARMTRYGELELAWFGEHDVLLPPNRYFDIDVGERDVNRIDSLQIASASEGIDVTVGG